MSAPYGDVCVHYADKWLVDDAGGGKEDGQGLGRFDYPEANVIVRIRGQSIGLSIPHSLSGCVYGEVPPPRQNERGCWTELEVGYWLRFCEQ